jgi:putative transposon-encoded protein
MKRIPITTTNELTIKNIVGFYQRTVSTFGNSAKVDCPKEHIGKTVYLVVCKK